MNWRTGVLLTAVLLQGCQSNPDRDDLQRQEPNTALARTYQELAVAYLQQGAVEVALEQAQRSLALDPNYGPAHNITALIYQRLGQAEKAEVAFKTAVDKDPNNSYIHNAYGAFLCQQKRYPAAHQQFELALKNPLYRTPEQTETNAGVCAMSAGQLADAERYLRSSLKRKRQQPKALISMANISFLNYKFLSTRAYLQRFHETAQPTASSLWLGIRTERRLGDEAAVKDFSEKLVRKFPDSTETADYYDSISVQP